MTNDYKLNKIKTAWKKREQKKSEDEKKRREEALKCAKKAAALLMEKYGAKKIRLFGSLVCGKHYSVKSDIDLYIEGFPSNADYWEALSQADHAAAPFPLNLIFEENALPSLKEKAFNEGIIL